MTKLTLGVITLACVWAVTLLGLQRSGEAPSSRYPNELDKFRFYDSSKWKALTPLVSTISDVRKVLGTPDDVRDISHYTAPYPGDDKAQAPVFTYTMNADWEILIYFVKDCGYSVKGDIPSGNRLCTVELVPRRPLAFNSAALPPAFTKRHTNGADAAWDEFYDSYGLEYHIYTTGTPYGHHRPGDLNRIVYGPTAEDLRKFEMVRRKDLF